MNDRERHVCYYDPATMGFVVVDRTKLPDTSGVGHELPEGSYKRLSPEEVKAIVLEANRHNFLDQAVRDNFDMEVTRRHMDMIDTLIQTRST